MKHKYILVIITVLFMNLMPTMAQEKKQFDIQKFKETRAEFIITEVGLTESESKVFIPLVNELIDKRFELNRSMKMEGRELKNKKDKTNTDYDKYIQAGFNNRTKELELDKEYYEKFKKVLSPEKIYKYHRAENKFMRNMVGQQKNKSQSSKK